MLDETRDPREPQDPAGLGHHARTYARDLRLQPAREHLQQETDDGLLDPKTFAATVRDAAARLQAWHTDRVGPRPAGRLRPIAPVELSDLTRRWATVAYHRIYDPDGRPRALRRARASSRPARSTVRSMDVRLDPMTEQEYAAYAETSVEGYAKAIADSGSLPEQEARERAVEQTAELLPQGLHTPDHYFFTARDGDRPVGVLWLRVRQLSTGKEAFGFDFEVREELRGSGYGRAVMAAAEQWCRDQGVVSIGLNVFGNNHVARALYESEGYVVTATNMAKRL